MKSMRQRILESKDIQQEAVHIPEWGETVLVRGLTVPERNALSNEVYGENGPKDPLDKVNLYEASLVMATTRDPETEELVFERADRESLLRKNGAAVGRITRVARRISGLDTTVDVAEKNSEKTQN